MNNPEGQLRLDDSAALARSLAQLMEVAHQQLEASREVPALVRAVTGHLGCELSELAAVNQTFPSWEKVNVQRGVDAYLAAHSPGASWLGVSGHGVEHEELVNLLTMAERYRGQFELGAVGYATAAIGPDETTEVVTSGLVLTRSPGNAPLVVGLRDISLHGPPLYRLDVLGADRAQAAACRDEIERLTRERDVFRGQVLSFGFSEHRGNEVLSFLPRPQLSGEQVILPDGVLGAIERHVIGVGEQAVRLREHGQHLKRGLLLHGPPGTGKTHTVRYLMGRTTGSTVIVMTGAAMRMVSQAAALARRLQPAVVVLEDVDLVAMDRGFTPDGNPLLFSLLDAMDGVGADADVTFVLTTNRAQALERALADRPGRVDLAVEVPRPDAAGRMALLRLYAKELELPADVSSVVAGTEGMTASFFKELLRRAVLAALSGNGERVTSLSEAHLRQALDEMLGERQALTRSLLGGRDDSDDSEDSGMSDMEIIGLPRPMGGAFFAGPGLHP